MAQGIFPDINPATTSGNQLATILNSFKDSVASNHSGTSRPANLAAGGTWLDTTNDPTWELKIYDGSSDYIIATLNTSTGIVSVPNTENQFEIAKDSDDAIAPILKFLKSRTTGDQVLADDAIGELKMYGTTDLDAEVVQARMITYSAENVTSATTGSYIVFEACLAGTNTLQEWMRLVEGKAGIGKASPDEKLHAAGNLKGENISDTASPAKLVLDKARIASSGQVLSGDSLSQHETRSKDDAGTAFVGGLIEFVATENHTATARGTKASIQTIDVTTNTLSEKLEISERVKPKVDLELGLSNVHYFGDPDTNGSFRTRVNGGELIHEKRVGGSWEVYYIGDAPEVVQTEAVSFPVEYSKYHICTAALTATLPAPVANGRVTVKNLSGGTVTIARNATESIDGTAADYVSTSTNESITMVSDGTDWYII